MWAPEYNNITNVIVQVFSVQLSNTRLFARIENIRHLKKHMGKVSKSHLVNFFIPVRERDGRDEVRVFYLLSGHVDNLLPNRNESVRCWWQVVLDGLVQRGEVVARHGGVHVVLDMKVHVPIPTPHNRVVQIETSGTQSEVVHNPWIAVSIEIAMVHADMLGGVAQEK